MQSSQTGLGESRSIRRRTSSRTVNAISQTTHQPPDQQYGHPSRNELRTTPNARQKLLQDIPQEVGEVRPNSTSRGDGPPSLATARHSSVLAHRRARTGLAMLRGYVASADRAAVMRARAPALACRLANRSAWIRASITRAHKPTGARTPETAAFRHLASPSPDRPSSGPDHREEEDCRVNNDS